LAIFILFLNSSKRGDEVLDDLALRAFVHLLGGTQIRALREDRATRIGVFKNADTYADSSLSSRQNLIHPQQIRSERSPFSIRHPEVQYAVCIINKYRWSVRRLAISRLHFRLGRVGRRTQQEDLLR